VKKEAFNAFEKFAPIYHATQLSHALHQNSIKNPKLQTHTSLTLLIQRAAKYNVHGTLSLVIDSAIGEEYLVPILYAFCMVH
jgi:hypothetical protein